MDARNGPFNTRSAIAESENLEDEANMMGQTDIFGDMVNWGYLGREVVGELSYLDGNEPVFITHVVKDENGDLVHHP
jgi:hypothetical protein